MPVVIVSMLQRLDIHRDALVLPGIPDDECAGRAVDAQAQSSLGQTISVKRVDRSGRRHETPGRKQAPGALGVVGMKNGFET